MSEQAGDGFVKHLTEAENGKAAPEAVQSGDSEKATRTADETPLQGTAVGAPADSALAHFAVKRLCKTCVHQERSFTLPPLSKNCIHPLLPVNLVTGERKFPCIIARGYDQLCGWLGQKWEYKGQK